MQGHIPTAKSSKSLIFHGKKLFVHGSSPIFHGETPVRRFPCRPSHAFGRPTSGPSPGSVPRHSNAGHAAGATCDCSRIFMGISHRNIEGSPWFHWIGVGILLFWETSWGFLRWFRRKGNEEVDKMRSFEWKRIFQTPMNSRVYVNLPEGKNSSDFIAICWRFIGVDSRFMGIY